MIKLLNKWRTSPTLKNAKTVRTYALQHPMAACLLTVNDQRLIAFIIFQVSKELA